MSGRSHQKVKRAHNRLNRLYQTIMTARCDKVLVLREIQLSNIWIENIRFYRKCNEIVDDSTSDVINPEYVEDGALIWTGLSLSAVKECVEKFQLPKHVLKRHRGIMSGAGIR